MNLSSFGIDKVETPPKTARTIRVTRSSRKSTTPIDQFKNPILGIEVNLIKQLQQVENEYHGSSYKKRQILLDALEQIAQTNLGFKKQIMTAVKAWRKPVDDTSADNDVTAITDLLRAQNEFKTVKEKYQNSKSKIQQLKDEIESTKAETDRIIEETQKMKQKLFLESDHFAKARKLTEELTQLQTTFDNMFKPKEEVQLTGNLADLSRENENLKKELVKMRFELELSSQISKRLRFIEERANKENKN
ncbi:hypothetical protein TVAG_313950 [Trichomonas vaginalis G3]|uniref:Uncharacterized protein n=1 Tax=Trichomonas vaginalis (strain ATCC PRA-98 / G3) TaxID=412133 RepID=A2EKJ3_TRIV3|nr:hypothetical protein TVAGG3_0412260 [Trichomonas vaginalis G3]EAY06820.1 hypothetical protein TVAG_313950 [Trichomonas vaginalis G3]KAI5535436.1 hypothetical protein TVAGG3_0412260 [Trichomonas vaginalis G3]|eukprot:XP_001319043.1 hypothetical protein [Trichomonas vaginalis G3]